MVVVSGPQGGIALLPGYRTDVTGLTADESRALFVLLSGSAHADLGLGQALGSALRKVMAALPARHRPDADLASRRIEDIPAELAVAVRVRDDVLAMFLRVHAADLAAPAAAGPAPELEEEPGWTKVELRFRSLLAAQPLLAFGPDVEVLTPEDLRRTLAAQAEATVALYTLRKQRPRRLVSTMKRPSRQ